MSASPSHRKRTNATSPKDPVDGLKFWKRLCMSLKKSFLAIRFSIRPFHINYFYGLGAVPVSVTLLDRDFDDP